MAPYSSPVLIRAAEALRDAKLIWKDNIYTHFRGGLYDNPANIIINILIDQLLSSAVAYCLTFLSVVLCRGGTSA